jgi:hypothetical protein
MASSTEITNVFEYTLLGFKDYSMSHVLSEEMDKATKSPIVKPVSQMKLAPGSAVTIPNVSWEEFESILQELGEKRSARVAYSKGTLQIMVPLPEDEITRDLISDLVKILLKVRGIRYQPFGSTTFKLSSGNPFSNLNAARGRPLYR